MPIKLTCITIVFPAQNGDMSALPYAAMFLIGLIAGPIADTIRRRGILNTKNTRKLFTVLGKS